MVDSNPKLQSLKSIVEFKIKQDADKNENTKDSDALKAHENVDLHLTQYGLTTLRKLIQFSTFKKPLSEAMKSSSMTTNQNEQAKIIPVSTPATLPETASPQKQKGAKVPSKSLKDTGAKVAKAGKVINKMIPTTKISEKKETVKRNPDAFQRIAACAVKPEMFPYVKGIFNTELFVDCT